MQRNDYYNDPMLEAAADQVRSTYGHTLDFRRKGKSLLKFGRNPAVGTSKVTVAQQPTGVAEETYIFTNAITHISSSAADTGSVRVEGHTIDTTTGDLTFVVETATLTGTTEALLPTPLCRVTRVVNLTATAWTGNVYVFETDTVTSGVPQTAAKIHLTVPAGAQQSLKASTAISSVDYYIITQVQASLLEKTSAFAEVVLESRAINVSNGNVFTPRVTIETASSAGTTFIDLKPYVIIPPNSDVRLSAIADGANTDVGGWFNGLLANFS